jgi:ribonuclease HI
MPDYIIYTDGGSRGNPGPAAYGYVVTDGDGNVLLAEGKAIGTTTNNVAEYMAPIAALTALQKKISKRNAVGASVEIRMDSELVVRQVNREYKVKADTVKPLFVDLVNAMMDFAEVGFVHVPREQNKEADRLVNQALDGTKGEGIAKNLFS